MQVRSLGLEDPLVHGGCTSAPRPRWMLSSCMLVPTPHESFIGFTIGRHFLPPWSFLLQPILAMACLQVCLLPVDCAFLGVQQLSYSSLYPQH